MGRISRIVLAISLLFSVVCGFIPLPPSSVSTRDKKYVDYFLRLYSADIFSKKNFILTDLKTEYEGHSISKIEVSFSVYRDLSLDVARILLVEMVEDLLQRVNNDPGLKEKRLIQEPIVPKQLKFQIQAGNMLTENIDLQSVRLATLDKDVVTYETFPDRFWGVTPVTYQQESYYYSCMLTSRPYPFAVQVDQESYLPPEDRVRVRITHPELPPEYIFEGRKVAASKDSPHPMRYELEYLNFLQPFVEEAIQNQMEHEEVSPSEESQPEVVKKELIEPTKESESLEEAKQEEAVKPSEKPVEEKQKELLELSEAPEAVKEKKEEHLIPERKMPTSAQELLVGPEIPQEEVTEGVPIDESFFLHKDPEPAEVAKGVSIDEPNDANPQEATSTEAEKVPVDTHPLPPQEEQPQEEHTTSFVPSTEPEQEIAHSDSDAFEQEEEQEDPESGIITAAPEKTLEEQIEALMRKHDSEERRSELWELTRKLKQNMKKLTPEEIQALAVPRHQRETTAEISRHHAHLFEHRLERNDEDDN